MVRVSDASKHGRITGQPTTGTAFEYLTVPAGEIWYVERIGYRVKNGDTNNTATLGIIGEVTKEDYVEGSDTVGSYTVRAVSINMETNVNSPASFEEVINEYAYPGEVVVFAANGPPSEDLDTTYSIGIRRVA